MTKMVGSSRLHSFMLQKSIKGQSDYDLLGKIYLLMSFQVANRSNMDTALRRICSEQLRFQVHQGDLVVAVLIYHDLTLEVL